MRQRQIKMTGCHYPLKLRRCNMYSNKMRGRRRLRDFHHPLRVLRHEWVIKRLMYPYHEKMLGVARG